MKAPSASIVAKLSVAGLLVACGAPMMAEQGAQQEDGSTRIEAGETGQVCASLDETTLAAIEAGGTRLVLVLTEFRPPSPGRGRLVATLDGHEQTLGVFPPVAFGREDVDEHRRFQLTIPAAWSVPEPSGEICVSVRLLPDEGTGIARLRLETWVPGTDPGP